MVLGIGRRDCLVEFLDVVFVDDFLVVGFVVAFLALGLAVGLGILGMVPNDLGICLFLCAQTEMSIAASSTGGASGGSVARGASAPGASASGGRASGGIDRPPTQSKNTVSPCGTYTAVVKDTTILIHSHTIQTYSLPGPPTGPIKWEYVLTHSTTKLAVVVDSMVVVIDLRYEEPIFIYEEDGIADFQWIRPVPISGSGDSADIDAVDAVDADKKNALEGAYLNCKQLIVYTAGYLQAKLYSLDCTRTLWSIDKPITKVPIYRPNERFWTVVSSWRAPGTEDLFPLVHHMYNTGSRSYVLHQTSLPDPLLSTNFVVEWARSGKCLVYFNGTDILGGFKLKVVPVLGVSSSASTGGAGTVSGTLSGAGVGASGAAGTGGAAFSGSAAGTDGSGTFGTTAIAESKPLLSLTYLNEALDQDDAVHFRNSSYYMATMLHHGQDLVLVVSAGYDQALEIIVVSVDHLRVARTVNIKGWGGRNWHQDFDGYSTTYVQGTKTPVWDIKLVAVTEEYLVVHNERLVAVLGYVEGTFVPVDVIHTDVVISVEVGNEIVVNTESGRLVYDFESIVVS